MDYSALSNYGLAGILAGVIIWVHLHLVRVAIPKFLDDARAERKETVQAFRDEMAVERELHGRHVECLAARLVEIERAVAGHARPMI